MHSWKNHCCLDTTFYSTSDVKLLFWSFIQLEPGQMDVPTVYLGPFPLIYGLLISHSGYERPGDTMAVRNQRTQEG